MGRGVRKRASASMNKMHRSDKSLSRCFSISPGRETGVGSRDEQDGPGPHHVPEHTTIWEEAFLLPLGVDPESVIKVSEF